MHRTELLLILGCICLVGAACEKRKEKVPPAPAPGPSAEKPQVKAKAVPTRFRPEEEPLPVPPRRKEEAASWRVDVHPQALSRMISEGNTGSLKQSLARDIEAAARRDAAGESLLHHAARKDNQEIVSLLIDYGSDPEARNREGETPLLLAAEHSSNPWIAAVLLKSGANINAFDNAGNFILHKSILNEEGGPAMIGYLCRRGIEVDRRQGDRKDGFTPLHLAVLQANIKNVDALLRMGAEPLERVGEETTLHLIARSSGKKSEIHAPEILELMLEYDFNVNEQDGRGDTPLHIAARNNRSKLVRILLQHGASPEIKNWSGKTPADVAQEKVLPLFE